MRVAKSVVAAAAVTAVTLGVSTPAFAAASWKVVASPNSTTQDSFGAVALRSPNDAWAVGAGYSVIGGVFQERPLIEHYNGSGWQIATSPAPTGFPYVALSGVAAVSASDAWAVGLYFPSGNKAIHPLAEHYDGTAWSIVTVPQAELRSGLSAVAALSSGNVWAVGTAGTRSTSGVVSTHPLAEHYDGAAWSVVATPTIVGGGLNAVAAVSPTDVWAVGVQYTTGATTQNGIVLHYDGTAWSQVPVPAPTVPSGGLWNLGAVTSTPTGQIWASGTASSADGLSQYPFVEHFDGAAWSLTQLPGKGAGYTITTVSGIAAASDTDIWAVGGASTGNQQGVTLTEHYDGAAWTVVPSPDVNTADGLADVATNGTVAWAVGDTGTAGAATFQTLTELYS